MTNAEKLNAIWNVINWYKQTDGCEVLRRVWNDEIDGMFSSSWEEDLFRMFLEVESIVDEDPPKEEDDEDEIVGVENIISKCGPAFEYLREIVDEEGDDSMLNSLKDIFTEKTKKEAELIFRDILVERAAEYPNGVDFYSDNGSIDAGMYPTKASYVFPNLLLNTVNNLMGYLGADTLQMMCDRVNNDIGKDNYYNLERLKTDVQGSYELISAYLYDLSLQEQQLGDFRILPIVNSNPKMQSITFLYKEDELKLSLYENETEDGNEYLLAIMQLNGEDVVTADSKLVLSEEDLDESDRTEVSD